MLTSANGKMQSRDSDALLVLNDLVQKLTLRDTINHNTDNITHCRKQRMIEQREFTFYKLIIKLQSLKKCIKAHYFLCHCTVISLLFVETDSRSFGILGENHGFVLECCYTD